MRPRGAAWSRGGGMLGMLAAVLALAVVLRSRGARAPAELLRQINDDTKSLESTDGVVPRPVETVEQFYASQHPVYTRCAKAVDMPAFTEFVAQTCGNIHEVSGCSEPCAQALQAKSSEFGCCWETVMQAYAQIDASAELAWRSWQGALSGKCGISFKDEACGDSMGEHVYQHLRHEVQELRHQQAESRQVIKDLVAQTQGAAAHDLCLVGGAWVPCRDASFFAGRGTAGAHLAGHASAQQALSAKGGGRTPAAAGSKKESRQTEDKGKTALSEGKRAGASKLSTRNASKSVTGAATDHGAAGRARSLQLAKAKARVGGHAQPLKAPAATGHPAPQNARRGSVGAKSGVGKSASSGRAKPASIDVEPDYGVVVSKDARRMESAAQKKLDERRSSSSSFWPKGLWSAIRPIWPWQKGAFKSVQHAPHLKAHKRSADLLGDRAVALKHGMKMVDSPLPSTSDAPLWGRLEKVATDGTLAAPPTSKHGKLWGRSHRWGPSDRDITLPPARAKRVARPFGPHRPLMHVAGKGEERGSKGSRKKVWVSRNSPWAPDAGFLDPHDPAAKRLSAAGINVNSDMGVI